MSRSTITLDDIYILVFAIALSLIGSRVVHFHWYLISWLVASISVAAINYLRSRP